MFFVLLFLDMNNVIHFHVSVWWYVAALSEDMCAGAVVGRRG